MIDHNRHGSTYQPSSTCKRNWNVLAIVEFPKQSSSLLYGADQLSEVTT